MLSQAEGAAMEAKSMGQSGTAAYLGSIGSSVKETFKAGGGDLVRSLLAGGSTHTGSASGSGGASGGINRHSQRQQFLTPNADGTKKTFAEYEQKRFQDGAALAHRRDRPKEKTLTQPGPDDPAQNKAPSPAGATNPKKNPDATGT
jgi:hypothetical protein